MDLPWYDISSAALFLAADVGWPCKSFLLECDETDIDYLMFRLREAKKLLSSAVSNVSSGQGQL